MAKKGSKEDIFEKFQPVKFWSLPDRFQLWWVGVDGCVSEWVRVGVEGGWL
jgi:hypothetical protein